MPPAPILNIQSLRAVAALLVAFAHAIGSSRDYGMASPLGEFFGHWGALGVDIFFVISGFIMVTIQQRAPRAAWPFLRDRLRRIVPTYWFYCVAIVALYLAVPRLFNTVELGAGEVAASFLFVHHVFYEGYPIVGVGWTLEYELIFYTLFAAAIALGRPRLQYALLFAATLLLLPWLSGDGIFAEFGFGMALGLGYAAAQRRWMRLSPALGWALLLGGAALLTSNLFVSLRIDRALVYGIPATMIVAGALILPALHNRPLRLLGDASYSLYLSHWFATSAFYKVVSRVTPGLDATLALILCVIGCAVGAIIAWWAIEGPLLRLAASHRRRNA